MGTGDLCQVEEPSLKNGIFHIVIRPFLLRSRCGYPSAASWAVYMGQQCAGVFPGARGAAVIAQAIRGRTVVWDIDYKLWDSDCPFCDL